MSYHKIFNISSYPDRIARFDDPDRDGEPSRPIGDRRGNLYLYTEDLELAINVALVTNRPLLVSGPPGTGKSSLARNVARVLNWRYIETVISSQTRARDLLWQADLLRRFNDAHRNEVQPSWERYMRPGVLWQAFDPASAALMGLEDSHECGEHSSTGVRFRISESPRQEWSQRPSQNEQVTLRPALTRPTEITNSSGSKTPPLEDAAVSRDIVPAVVLLDEIDKADPDVPNNLLQAIGSMRFQVEELNGREVKAEYATAPLVIITTNGERVLPDAFVRRCVCIKLELPQGPRLVQMAESWFGSEHRLLYLAIAGHDAFPQDAETPAGKRKRGYQPSTAEFLDAVEVCLHWKAQPGSDLFKQVLRATLEKPVS